MVFTFVGLISRSWVSRSVTLFVFFRGWLTSSIFQRRSEMDVLSIAKPLSWITITNNHLYPIREGRTLKSRSSKLGTFEGHNYFYLGLPNFFSKQTFWNMCGLNMSNEHGEPTASYI